MGPVFLGDKAISEKDKKSEILCEEIDLVLSPAYGALPKISEEGSIVEERLSIKEEKDCDKSVYGNATF